MSNDLPPEWFAPFLVVQLGSNWSLTCPYCGVTWVVPVKDAPEYTPRGLILNLLNHERRCKKKLDNDRANS